MTQSRQFFIFRLLNSVLVIALVFVLSSCAGSEQRNPTNEEIAAALAKEKVDKKKTEEDQKAYKQKQDYLAKSQIDQMMKYQSIDVGTFDIERFFGDEYGAYKKGQYETNAEYIKRLKSQVNPDHVYYYETRAVLSDYDADNQYYKLIVPGEFFSGVSDPHFAYIDDIDSSLKDKDRENDNEGAFMWIPLAEDKKASAYNGRNAYGTQATVVKLETNKYGFAAFYNSFSGMYNYGYELVYRDIENDSTIPFPDILVILPLHDAMIHDLQKTKVIARVGIKFSYGVGPLALDRQLRMDTPTVASPIELNKTTYVLGVDLDSICLLKRQNREVLSCRLHLNENAAR